MHNTFVNRECNTVDIVSVEDSEEDSGASNGGGTEVIAEYEEAEADAPRGPLAEDGETEGAAASFCSGPLI